MFTGWLTKEHNMPAIYKMLTFIADTSENIFFSEAVIRNKLANSSLHSSLSFSYEMYIVRERSEEMLYWEVIVKFYPMWKVILNSVRRCSFELSMSHWSVHMVVAGIIKSIYYDLLNQVFLDFFLYYFRTLRTQSPKYEIVGGQFSATFYWVHVTWVLNAYVMVTLNFPLDKYKGTPSHVCKEDANQKCLIMLNTTTKV